MTTQCRNQEGFSLLEVIIAIGVFAVGISAVVGVLPALTRQASRSSDVVSATHLPDALRVELQRLAVAGGFDALAAQTKPLAMPLPDTCQLVATRDASRLHVLNHRPPPVVEQIDASEQYFLIEVWRLADGPLAFESGGAVLVLHGRISWPYRTPGASAATPAVEREQVSFNLALNR